MHQHCITIINSHLLLTATWQVHISNPPQRKGSLQGLVWWPLLRRGLDSYDLLITNMVITNFSTFNRTTNFTTNSSSLPTPINLETHITRPQSKTPAKYTFFTYPLQHGSFNYLIQKKIPNSNLFVVTHSSLPIKQEPKYSNTYIYITIYFTNNSQKIKGRKPKGKLFHMPLPISPHPHLISIF